MGKGYTAEKFGNFGFLALNGKLVNHKSTIHENTRAKKALETAAEELGISIFDADDSENLNFITVTEEEIAKLESFNNVFKCEVIEENGIVQKVIKTKTNNNDNIRRYYWNVKCGASIRKKVIFQKSHASVLTKSQENNSRSKTLNIRNFKDKYYSHIPVKLIEVDTNMTKQYFHFFLESKEQVFLNLKLLPSLSPSIVGLKCYFTVPYPNILFRYSSIISRFVVKFCKLLNIPVPDTIETIIELLTKYVFVRQNSSKVLTVLFSIFAKPGESDDFKMRSALTCRKILDSILFLIRFWIIYDGKKSKKMNLFLNDTIRDELNIRGLSSEIYDEILKIYRAIRNEELKLKNNNYTNSHNGNGIILNNKRFKPQYLNGIFRSALERLECFEYHFFDRWKICHTQTMEFFFKHYRGNQGELNWFNFQPQIGVYEDTDRLKDNIDSYARTLLIAIYFSTPRPPQVASLRTLLFQGGTNFYWFEKDELVIRIFLIRKSNKKQQLNFFIGKTLSKNIIFFLFVLKPVYTSLLAMATGYTNSFDINSKTKIRILRDDSRGFGNANDNEDDHDGEDDEHEDDIDLDEVCNPGDKNGSYIFNNFFCSYWFKSGDEYNISLYSRHQLWITINGLGIMEYPFDFSEYRQVVPEIASVILKEHFSKDTLVGFLEYGVQRSPQYNRGTASQHQALNSDGVSSLTSLKNEHSLCSIWQEFLSKTNVKQQEDPMLSTVSPNKVGDTVVDTASGRTIASWTPSLEKIIYTAQEHFNIKLRQFQDVLLSMLMQSEAKSICVRFPTGFGKTMSIVLFFRIYNLLVSPIKVLIIVPFNTVKLELIDKYEIMEDYGLDSFCEFIEVANIDSVNLAFEQSTKKYDYILIDEFYEIASNADRKIHVADFNNMIYKKANTVIYASATSFGTDSYPFKLTNRNEETIENEIAGKITTIDFNFLYDPKYKICNKRYELIQALVSEVKILIHNNKKVLIICRSFADVELFKEKYFKEAATYIVPGKPSESLLDSRLIIGTSMISSGINIPGLNFVFVLDYHDLHYFIQCAGRIRDEGIAINVSIERDTPCVGCLIDKAYEKTADKCNHQSTIFDNIIKELASENNHDNDDNNIYDNNNNNTDNIIDNIIDYIDIGENQTYTEELCAIDDEEIIETSRKRQKTNLHSTYNHLSLKEGMQSVSNISYIFKEIDAIRLFLKANNVSLSLSSQNNNEGNLLLYWHLSQVALGETDFESIINQSQKPITEEVEKTICDWFENSPFEIEQWRHYSKLKHLKLPSEYDSSQIKCRFNSVFLEISSEFCFIDLESFSKGKLVYKTDITNNYPLYEWKKPTFNEIRKILKLINFNCPTFETFFRTDSIFHLEKSNGICLNCFRFNCTNELTCPFESKFPILIFMLIMFYNHHETIGVVEEFVQQIYFFDDWVKHMLSSSKLNGIYNFHIWMVTLANTEKGKSVLCVD